MAAAATLVIEFRRGGERIKLAANRPTRGQIPLPGAEHPVGARRLPGRKAQQLLFAAGIGMDCSMVDGRQDGSVCVGKLYRHLSVSAEFCM
jgi:tRNA(Ile)-lysidine synthase